MRQVRWAVAIAVIVLAGFWLLPSSLGGQTTYVSTYGNSMEPSFKAGDLAVLRPAGTYSTGDVVAYRSELLGTTVMHRIVGIEDAHYSLKGDNNSWLDPEQPAESHLIGKLAFQVPQGGLWLDRLTSPPVLGLIAFALVASGGTAAATRKKRRNRRATVSRHLSDRRAKPLPAAGLAISNLSPSLRLAAGGAALVAVLGASLGVAAWAGPLEESSSAAVQSGTSMKFSYTADVGRSAAYDGTTAVSPAPVFRKLADTVQVDFTYEGEPGTVAVDAELSSPSGWRSTVPLAEPQTFSGRAYDGKVTLDLEALQAKADAAAAATGLPAAPVALTVVPKVATESGAEFNPELKLTLAPLQLAMVGGEEALTVTDSSTNQQTVMAPRTIGFNSWRITAETARILSALLVLAGVVTGAAVLLLAHRSAPVDEATAILRRYANLLVHVHPMTTPQGHPVIDVTTFATLAKLAERYGLLVLHWNRSGVETFIVRDENITYRYRPGASRPAADPAVTPDVQNASAVELLPKR
ncbi:signal peptidase I [Pseudarthrobacter sp. NPDC092439]|uniref:signal peptidase I n=1 Tax=unclassified Pseudarthrobacter TaxID=2647000 RepID=UPI0038058488